MSYPQFDAACAALRQTLREVVHTEGVPLTNVDGSFVLDDEGRVVYEDSHPATRAGLPSFFRRVRKSAARATGLRGAFSGKQKA
jgi:hypothetical protein